LSIGVGWLSDNSFRNPLYLQSNRLDSGFHSFETLSGLVENRGRSRGPVRSLEKSASKPDRQRTENEDGEDDG
jgi:hypothetical protein